MGNTPFHSVAGCWAAVHPHACGEYTCPRSVSSFSNGSSPRVWGILTASIRGQRCQRFIPTRVGNTCSPMVGMGRQTVHPHACGEYTGFKALHPHPIGSSPRVWGIRSLLGSTILASWFIPTRVGNTLQEDARNNRLLAELQRATEPCVLQACSDDDKKGKELCKAAPSPRKTLPGRAVTLS